MDVLIIYPYCTFGGVERLILNRAIAFKKHHLRVVTHIGYLSDSGALDSFRNYINKRNLEKFILPFIIKEFSFVDNSKFDLTLLIDSPQIFDRLSSYRNVFIECHTPYIDNRRYLGNISKKFKGIIVPSLAFKNIILNERPNINSPIVIPNPIPDEFHHTFDISSYLPRRPLVYLARLDNLKNFNEAIRIFSIFKDRKDIMFIAIGEGSADREIISLFKNMGLLENSILRDKINFYQVPKLIRMVKKSKGMFISPSKGESFGLSAAEFISGGVPVLLSKIPAHNELVENDDQFIYNLGDLDSAKLKIERILEKWDAFSISIQKHGQKFKDDFFIEAWKNFINSQGI